MKLQELLANIDNIEVAQLQESKQEALFTSVIQKELSKTTSKLVNEITKRLKALKGKQVIIHSNAALTKVEAMMYNNQPASNTPGPFLIETIKVTNLSLFGEIGIQVDIRGTDQSSGNTGLISINHLKTISLLTIELVG